MKLSSFTDYALRTLIFAGTSDGPVTISQIAETYCISKNHLRKAVHQLSRTGFIKTSQGRNGGILLNKAASEIRIGDVVRTFENMEIVECFDNQTNTCPIDGMCKLKTALRKAQASFLRSLDEYTLYDIIGNKKLKRFVLIASL